MTYNAYHTIGIVQIMTCFHHSTCISREIKIYWSLGALYFYSLKVYFLIYNQVLLFVFKEIILNRD